MGLSDRVIADAILNHQIDLLRLEAGVRARVMRLLNELQVELSSRLMAPNQLTTFTKDRLRTLLKQANESMDQYYVRIEGEMDQMLRGLADLQAQQVSRVLTIQTAASLPTETFLARLVSNVLIHGAPSASWWEKQNLDTAFRFAGAVRRGVAQGETNEQIVARLVGKPRLGIPGVMEVSRRNARSLVQTSIQTVANASRMETFRQNSNVIKGIRQLSTFDSHTTEICLAYSEGEWDLEGEPLEGTNLPFINEGGSVDGVPRHWGCRSVMVPITKTFRELGIDMNEIPGGARASAEGPVSNRITMEEWLDSRTTQQQDEQLGPGRAKLWREGNLTLEQLLSLDGTKLTLDQLRRKYK